MISMRSSRSVWWAWNGKYTTVRVVALLVLVAIFPISYLSILKSFKVSSPAPAHLAKNVGSKGILCWVPVPAPLWSNESNVIHVKRTWGARCDKLIFISTETDQQLGAIGLPNIIESRERLWGKVKRALKFIWEEYGKEYDWFLKADDDTYVVMENLRYFLKDYDPNEPYYFGCRLQYEDIKPSVNFGGAGYVLSRETLRVFVEQALPDAEKCKQDDVGDEDTELGKCLANVGITPADTRDKEGKHRFLHSNPEYHFGTLMESAKWLYVRDPEAPGLDCCSPGIISFHHASPETLYALEFLIYHFHLYDSHEPRRST